MRLSHEQRVEIIKNLSLKNGGMITTGQIEEAGISKPLIPALIENGILSRKRRGIFYYADSFPDDFQIIQMHSPKIVFSYGTALFLWNMSDRIPHSFDITVPAGFNSTQLKEEQYQLNFHHTSLSRWNIGITETKSPCGNIVRLYNKERCIVDLIKRKNRIDKQIYIQALREYFSDKTTDKITLLEYAKMFNIESKVRDYMDVLTG